MMDRGLAASFADRGAMPRGVRARAPLRLGLAGGGTDVSPYPETFGGAIINVSINKFAYASLCLREDDEIVFRSADLGLEDRFRIADGVGSDCRLKLHRGVYERIIHQFCGGKNLGVTLISHVDAPVGSGLGSSSALVVAMVAAFRHLLNLPLGEYEVARLSYDIERIDLDLKGGRQDQYAATFGGFNFMEFQSNERVVVNPLRIRDPIRNELESSILLAFSGVSRESARIISAQALSVSGGGSPLDAMHRMKREATEMKEALLFGDIDRMCEILSSGWDAKKRTASTVSTPEVEALFSIAMENGARAGKLSGAGGGGFALFIVDPDRRPELEDAIRKNTRAIPTPCNFTSSGVESWTFA